MNAGKVLACDAPQKLIDGRGAASLEEAFIGYMEDAIADDAPRGAGKAAAAGAEPAAEPRRRPPPRRRRSRSPAAALRPDAAPTRATRPMQILRDPVRLAFAFVGSALLMLVFGFGITTDVEHIRYAVARSRSVAREPRVPRAVRRRRRATSPATPPARSADEALERLQSDDVSLVARDPAELRPRLPPGLRPRGPGAGRRRHDRSAATPSRSTSQGVHDTLLQDPGDRAADGHAAEVHAPTSRSGTCTTRRSRASTRSCRASRRCCCS